MNWQVSHPCSLSNSGIVIPLPLTTSAIVISFGGGVIAVGPASLVCRSLAQRTCCLDGQLLPIRARRQGRGIVVPNHGIAEGQVWSFTYD